MHVNRFAQFRSPQIKSSKFFVRKEGSFYRANKLRQRADIDAYRVASQCQRLYKACPSAHERIENEVAGAGKRFYGGAYKRRRKSGWIPIKVMRETADWMDVASRIDEIELNVIFHVQLDKIRMLLKSALHDQTESSFI